MFRRRSATARSVAALALAAVSAFALAACGSSSSSSSASSATSGGASTSATAAASTTSGSCGTLPNVPANDPNGLIPALGSGYPANYEGFTDFPVAKSPWINWKPAHKSGWNVQVVWTPLTNPFTNTTLNALKQRLMASGKVSTIGVQAPADVHGCSAAVAGDRDRDSAQAGHPDRVPTGPPADRSAHRPGGKGRNSDDLGVDADSK